MRSGGINYRTTDETRRWAAAVVAGVPVDDLDEGTDDLKGYRSQSESNMRLAGTAVADRDHVVAAIAW